MSVSDSIQGNLIDDLEKRFININLRDLPILANIFEDELSNYLRHYIRTICFPKAKDLSLSNSDFMILDGERSFEIIVQSKADEYSGLIVVVIERGPLAVQGNIISHNISIAEYGMFGNIELTLPSSLEKKLKGLVDGLQVFLVRSNRWLTDLISDTVFEYETKLSRKLYRYIRSIINNDALCDKVWLSTYTKNKAHYILDSQMTRSTMIRLSEASHSYGITPAIVMSHFLNCNVPIDDTFGLTVAKEGKSLDAKFQDAKYLESLSDLSRAQAIVFGPEAMTLYPLYKHERYPFLNCTFPTCNKDIIEPILKEHSEKIGLIFEDSISDLIDVYKKLSGVKSSVEYSKLGEFLGAFTVGAIKSM